MERARIQFEHRGETYKNFAEVAKKYNQSYHMLLTAYKKGLNINLFLDILDGVVEDKSKAYSKPFNHNGVLYNDLENFVIRYRLSHIQTVIHINESKTLDQILATSKARKTSRAQKVKYNSKWYRSVMDLALTLDVDHQYLRRKLKETDDIHKAVELSKLHKNKSRRKDAALKSLK